MNEDSRKKTQAEKMRRYRKRKKAERLGIPIPEEAKLQSVKLSDDPNAQKMRRFRNRKKSDHSEMRTPQASSIQKC